jgi:UDP-N-acetylmuramoylalanine--D-glutamate ligase
MSGASVGRLGRDSDWTAVRVSVLGLGVAGYSCADALMQLGAKVTIIDETDGDAQRERAEILGPLGASVLLGPGSQIPVDTDVVVASPGIRPSSEIFAPARHAGIPIWGELELAWRLRRGSADAPWLCVTGTNGKTTTTLMLESMLSASGARAVAAGNIGNPLVDVVLHDQVDVIAVEVGAPQLPFVTSMSPWAAVCLNIAADHLDHFENFDNYLAAKERIFHQSQVAAVYVVEEEDTRAMVERADVVEGCRGIGVTTGVPGVGMLGVVDEYLVDRAFIGNRREAAQELASISDVQPAAPHNVVNALAAAALARAYGVEPSAVQEGLRLFTPAPHRIADVGVANGVKFIDDSKATNAHAAAMSLRAYPSVVWIAGGMAKGQDFDELVRGVSDRLAGVVLLGVDAPVLASALARHAPDVPMITIHRTDTGAMSEAVASAASMAAPGDVVLLAPGCASWDMFDDYTHRGRLFAEAVHQHMAGTVKPA